MPLAGDYTNNNKYTILIADGGVVGEFGSIITDNTQAFLTPVPQFAAIYHQTFVELFGQFVPVPKPGVIYMALNLSYQASLFQSDLADFQNDQRLLNWKAPCNRFKDDKGEMEVITFRSYLVGQYSNGHTVGDDECQFASSYNLGGMQFGLEAAINEEGLIAVFGGYSRAKAKGYGNEGDVWSNNYTGGIIGQYFGDIVTVNLTALDTVSTFHTKRTLDNAFSNSGKVNGNSFSTEAKVLFNTNAGECFFRPYVSLRYMANYLDSFDESKSIDNGATDQYHFTKNNFHRLEGRAGLFLAGEIQLADKCAINPSLNVAWMQQLLGNTANINFKEITGLFGSS